MNLVAEVLVGGATIATLAPIIATAAVSIASRSEDANWTLDEPPSGMIQTVSRRLLGFRSECGSQRRPHSRRCGTRTAVDPVYQAPARRTG